MQPFKYQPKINTGKLNKRINIKKEQRTSDGGGGFGNDDTLIASVWASINTLNGREQWQAQQMEAEVSHKVIIRYREGIKRTQVVYYKNRKFDIQYVFNRNEENRFLELYCLEKV